MTAFECYKTYLALKNHFTKDSYDYHKYGGKVSASVKSFEGRRDRYYFEKLAKKRDASNFLLANMVENPSVWVGELVSGDQSESIFRQWQKRNQALTYTFREEVNSLHTAEDFNSLFRADDGGHPPVLRAFLRKQISIETLIILVHMTGCFGRWNKAMEYDPVWREVARKIIKYQPFMKYNITSLRKIVIDIFS